jgi:cystathionine gamma-synthase
MRPATRLVWVETPANPTWEVTDLAATAEIAHRGGALLCVDSTCATPVHTQPIAHGADIVMHSATKYLGGHTDVLGGMLVAAKIDEHWEQIAALRHDEGAVIGPMEAYLLLRGMRTLFARVERSSKTALAIAERAAFLPNVNVLYPGLSSHPQHAVAKKQMSRGFGSMLSIRVGGTGQTAVGVIQRMKLWVPATSLGGVESLVEHRYSVEGANTPTPEDLLRLSVGLEHEDDLYEDLRQALEYRT